MMRASIEASAQAEPEMPAHQRTHQDIDLREPAVHPAGQQLCKRKQPLGDAAVVHQVACEDEKRGIARKVYDWVWATTRCTVIENGISGWLRKNPHAGKRHDKSDWYIEQKQYYKRNTK